MGGLARLLRAATPRAPAIRAPTAIIEKITSADILTTAASASVAVASFNTRRWLGPAAAGTAALMKTLASPSAAVGEALGRKNAVGGVLCMRQQAPVGRAASKHCV